MKKMQKLLCLLLALLMVLPVLAACKKDKQSDTDQSTKQQDTIAGIAKKNYNKEFTIVNPKDTVYDTYYWAEDNSDSSNIAIANYQREVAIEEHLGIEIYHVTLDSSEGVLYQAFEQMHFAGNDDYQLALTHPFVDLVSLMGADYLVDLSEIPEISLNSDYYNLNIMESIKYQGHMYLGSSSMILHTPMVILFNKQIADSYEEVGSDKLYQHVRDKTWTMDQMFTYAQLIDISLNASEADPMYGKYGFVSNIDTEMCSFVSASGYFHVSIDEDGVYQLQNFNENIFNIFKKFVAITDSEYFYGWKWHETTKKLTMDTGRAFFSAASQDYMIDQMTTSEIPLGVLPYPTIETGMTSQNQDWSGYFIIPTTVTDKPLCGEVVELFSYFGETKIKYEFYDVLLGLRASQEPQDTEMLELIFDNLVVDPALAFLNKGDGDLSRIFYIVPFMIRDNEKAMASWYAKYYDAAKIHLDEVNELDEAAE